MTIQVQVADGTMITALEQPPPGLTIDDAAPKSQDGFLIWDVREPEPAPVAGPVGQRRNRHFRSTTSRDNDVGRRVPVNRGMCPGFRGVCDTVLTQLGWRVTRHSSTKKG